MGSSTPISKPPALGHWAKGKNKRKVPTWGPGHFARPLSTFRRVDRVADAGLLFTNPNGIFFEIFGNPKILPSFAEVRVHFLEI